MGVLNPDCEEERTCPGREEEEEHWRIATRQVHVGVVQKLRCGAINPDMTVDENGQIFLNAGRYQYQSCYRLIYYI